MLGNAVHRVRGAVSSRVRPGSHEAATDRSDPGAEPESPTPVAVSGLVEEFSRRRIVGWVSVPPSAPPTRVRLLVDHLEVTATYATPGPSLSAARGPARSPAADSPPPEAEDPDSVDPEAEAPAGSGAQRGRVPPVPGPPEDRRNSLEEIRTFSFRIRDLWPYVRRVHRITVRAEDRPLPIAGHGMYLSPPRKGQRSKAELRAKLASGHVLSQYGRLQLSKQLDPEWQAGVLGLYQRTRDILGAHHDYEPFFVYGTLLGAVREGGFIGHDIDFDAAYLSRHRTGPEAAAELAEVALTLIEQGLDVDCRFTALHVHDPQDRERRIDLFHLYFDESGVLRFPFGVAGSTTVTLEDWQGTREIDFPGGRGLIPGNAEQLVRHIYGDDWRWPKPGFNWALDRTDADPSGQVPTALRTKAYWANFYAHTHYTTGSSFCEFVARREDTPSTIVDIGCGDGRDSCAFAASGRTVLGLDQSPVGIEHARAKAGERGLGDRADFEVCDVSAVDDLGAALDRIAERAPGPVLFYLRFFLHAISEDVQAALLHAIDSHARPGDQLAAEFRTDKDEQNAKVHTKHYRRFQDAEVFRADLAARGWRVQHHEEGAGLSPYRGEDPVLCRVVATR